MMLMHFLRRLALVVVSGIFAFTLFWFGLTFGGERVFGTPNAIKQSLVSSGVYKSIIGDALDQAQKKMKTDQAGDNSPDIPIDDPELRKIIVQAFPPEYLQTQTENTLDGIYGWLQGKTPQLVFDIDLTDSKARLADGVGSYATTRLSSLPFCTPGSPADDVNPFNATCVPRGFDIAAASSKAREKIAGEEFIKDTHINAQTLKIGDEKQTIDQKLRQAPKIYQLAQKAIYGLGVLALLTGASVLFLSETRRAGLRKLSVTGISVGISLSAVGFVSWFASNKLANRFTATAESKEPLQQTLMQIVQTLAGDLRVWWIGLGITLLVLGIGGIITLRCTRPKIEQSDEAPAEAADLPKEPTPPKEKPKPATPKKSPNL